MEYFRMEETDVHGLETVIKGIQPLDEETKNKAVVRLDSLIKPIGSLGALEGIGAQLAGITSKVKGHTFKKCVVVLCADNGVCVEGVSACPQQITTVQTMNFMKGIAAINVLCKHAGSDVEVIDIGINSDVTHDGLTPKKIRKGTSNMAKGPAMTREEAVQSLEIGISTVTGLAQQGYNLLGTGEMGIGNTSTSSAILVAFTGCPVQEAVGKGAGLTDEGFEQKKSVVEAAIHLNQPDREDALDVLSKVGGFDIAGMAGCFLGAAYHRVPIVIDGFISAAAALVAYRINPLAKQYMIASHNSKEPGFQHIMKEMGMSPMLDLGMRLGEGTGCPLAFNLIEAASKIMDEMATFDEAAMVNNFLVDIR